MELVSTASSFLKKYSTWFFTALALLPALQLYMPVAQMLLSPLAYAVLTASVAALGIFATQVKQKSLSPDTPPVVDTIVATPKDPS